MLGFSKTLPPRKLETKSEEVLAKETALALRAIAGFHAYWWNNEKVEEFDWLTNSPTDFDAVNRWIL